MNDLLKKYIKEIILEIQGNPRVSDQLVKKKSNSKKEDKKDKEEEEVEEMSTVATSLVPGGGFTTPLGWTSADMQGPGARSKGRKKSKRR
jgi:hypothetical protein